MGAAFSPPPISSRRWRRSSTAPRPSASSAICPWKARTPAPSRCCSRFRSAFACARRSCGIGGASSRSSTISKRLYAGLDSKPEAEIGLSASALIDLFEKLVHRVQRKSTARMAMLVNAELQNFPCFKVNSPVHRPRRDSATRFCEIADEVAVSNPPQIGTSDNSRRLTAG